MDASEAALYPVTIIAGLRVAMRDGVELNIRLTRPDAPGPFPAIVEYNPYRRLAAPLRDYRDEYPPVVPWLAEHGYVVVQFDVRGTGASSGASTDIYSDAERRDGYDMIEWAAAQDWCTGAVGMIGKSYGAVVQWHVAAQAPPHLKAIIVRSAGDDVYTEFTNPGGCLRPWLFESYAPQMNALGFAPPDPALTGPRWAAIWHERLDGSAPWSLGYLRNRLHGDYWRDRSLAPDYGRVKCAVYLIEGWPDWYASAELRAFQRLHAPRKVLIGPWGHYYPEEKGALPGPRIDTRREYVRWFDHWLKGIDTGIMKEPPVTVFVREWAQPAALCLEDSGTWRSLLSWPPAHVQPTELHFAADGQLGGTPEAVAGADTYTYRPSVGMTTGRRGLGSTTPWGTPIDQRADEAFSMLYTTPVLTEPMELLGEPDIILHVSSTAQTAYFHARLCDVAPDGTSRLIADGGLLANHRASHQNPEPLVPGEIVALRFPLKHCAYAIARGHRLRVAVASADFQNAWPTGEAAENTVHRGGAHSSRIRLPVAGPCHELLPPPEFAPSPHPLPAEDALARPEYTMRWDLVADSVTCELASVEARASGIGNRSRYTVSNRTPAETSIESSYTYRAPHPTLDIRVEATCQTTSDAVSYTHASQVEIRVGGRIHFRKSWTESVPRGWS